MTPPPDPDLLDANPSPATGPYRALVFGETLFDHFPDGTRVLGGAPFNVAWHLSGFDTDPLLVSAVGADKEGNDVFAHMVEWGMDPTGVQVHPQKPTGRVRTELENGEPRFHIEPLQAYDEITARDLPSPAMLSEVRLLYHGTLALREAPSRRTLEYLRDILSVPVLVDANLRDPWWNQRTVEWALEGADFLKLNREELALLTRAPVGDEEDVAAAARKLQDEFSIGQVVVTLGAAGALGIATEEVVRTVAPEVREIRDTVGAGDAFSAVLALGVRHGWPLETTLQRAGAFAADLCRVRGATPPDHGLYEAHGRRWKHVG